MKSLSASVLCVVAVWVIGAELFAQVRFSSSTSLLTLDVSVLDDDGKPVTGLRPEDFVVTVNREVQPVRTIVFLATQNTRTAVTEPASSKTDAPVVLPASSGSSSEPDPKLMVILVDDMSVQATDSKGLFVAAERFVDAIPPRDWVGLASTSGRVNVNPSIDRAPLKANLRRSFGWMIDPRGDRQPFVGFIDALEVDAGSQSAQLNLIEVACGLPRSIMVSRTLADLLVQYQCASDALRRARANAAFARIQTRNQLDKFVDVINAMASAPGVKQLVILTGGVALRPAESSDFVRVAGAAAAAGVQLTILMEEPDENDISRHPVQRDYARDQRQLMQQAQTLAEFSGGLFYRVIGQADRFYQRVLESSSSVYRLGVDLPKDVPKDGNYKIEVAIKRPGVKVHASRYAAPAPPRKALTPEERMKEAIKTGTPSYALPVQMSADVVSARGPSPIAIRVSLDVPGDQRGPISCIFGVVGPDRVLKSGRRDLARSADTKTYHLEFLIPAAVGTYELRFAAVDASGAVGATAQLVVVK